MSDEYKKYVSYFQRVTTIGVLACGKDNEEANKEASAIMEGGYPIERCFYDETPFMLTDSEEWNPDFEILSVDPSQSKGSLDYSIKINDQYNQVIANSLNKNVEDLTDLDCQNFFMEAMTEFIKKAEKRYGKE